MLDINFWEKQRIRAQAQINKMEENYKKEISYSIRHTSIYTKEVEKSFIRNVFISGKKFNSIVEETDSVSAVLEYGNKPESGRVAILNFACYEKPGGGFTNGSIAQEECLCHESSLYNVLRKFPEYYAHNSEFTNNFLYTNRALYSKDIIFERDNISCKCDVITCAAPNYTAASEYCRVSKEENSKVLRERIKFVLDIANDNKVDTLILGAYGAGVFGQSAEEVARIFKEYLDENRYCFRKIIFAIIPGVNVEPFKKAFE